MEPYRFTFGGQRRYYEWEASLAPLPEKKWGYFFVEDKPEDMEIHILPMLAAQSGFPPGPLRGFHKIFDQRVWK
jgi:hypothetical protein